jgi:hypothetical protein
MVKPITIALIALTFCLSACSPSASASGSVATTAEVAGTYECFGLENGSATTISTLSLNADGTGVFGTTMITWTYDPATSLITFNGDAALQEATFLSDGPTLSVNLRADAIVSGAPGGHFTCVKT